MTLKQIASLDEISHGPIRERAEHAGVGSCRYVLVDEEAEIGFLALDRRAEWLSLYEVFVPKEHRRRGIGGRLLKEAERIGQE